MQTCQQPVDVGTGVLGNFAHAMAAKGLIEVDPFLHLFTLFYC